MKKTIAKKSKSLPTKKKDKLLKRFNKTKVKPKNFTRKSLNSCPDCLSQL